MPQPISAFPPVPLTESGVPAFMTMPLQMSTAGADSEPTPPQGGVAAPSEPAAGSPDAAAGRRTGRQEAERPFTVLMPDAPDYPGVRKDRNWGLRIHRGRRLPKALASYAARPHTWEQLVQDELNGKPRIPGRMPSPMPGLRDYQVPRARGIGAAHNDGKPGYALVAPTGSGKTAMVVRGLGGRPVHTILVVTKRSIIPNWQRCIDLFGAGQRWVVINPERLWRLFIHPSILLADQSPERAAELAATEGTARVHFDTVVVDESQILAYPESLRSRQVHRLLHPERGRRPFFVAASATPFTTLAETAYAADLIAYAAEADPPDDLRGQDYLDWLAGLRVVAADGSKGQLTDAEKVKELLYRRGVGSSATTEELGLPAQQRELHFVELTESEHASYDQAWEEFLRVHAPNGATADTEFDESRASVPLRRVMQASLLKAPHVARHVADLVSEGHQVIVPAWYLLTIRALAVHIARELRNRGLPDRVVEITGEQPGLRELKRAAFQLGRAWVCVTNVVDGISLHAGELNVDGKGTDATPTPRRTVMADVLTGGKRLLQGEGRGQRDGHQAPVVYLVVAGTKEQQWLARTLLAASQTQELAHASADAEALFLMYCELDDEPATGSPGAAR
ncbi:helicase [Streptomyces niveus]|uniref:helicase n=1 Tax=Streptomyces niveus TaxID=193462 RepID=UPI003658F2C2